VRLWALPGRWLRDWRRRRAINRAVREGYHLNRNEFQATAEAVDAFGEALEPYAGQLKPSEEPTQGDKYEIGNCL